MRRWEYLVFNINWSVENNDWIALSLYSGEIIVDMNEILNHYGAIGWELANILDEFSITNAGIREVKSYLVILKRSLES